MKFGKLFLGLASACGLVAMGPVANAATMSLSIQLQDMSNVDLPQVAGVYTLTQGQEFRVLIKASIAGNGNTDSFHFDNENAVALPPVALGLVGFQADLINANNRIAPGITATGTKWANTNGAANNVGGLANRLTSPASLINSLGFTPSDLGSDGDTDIAGIGYANTAAITSGYTESLVTGVTTASIQNGLGTQNLVIRGSFIANTVGTAGLSFANIVGNYFVDPLAQDNSLQSVAFTSGEISSTGATITIVPVPEPTSLALMGLASVGLLARRRRMA